MRPLHKLRKVETVDAPPFSQGKARGVLQKGVVYEQHLLGHVKQLFPELIVMGGVWFKFLDGSKSGYAQTDILVGFPGKVLIIEAKLTQTEKGDLQLTKWYAPIVSFWAKPHGVVLVQAFKNATYRSEGEHLTDLGRARDLSPSDSVVHTYQFIPRRK